MPYCPHILNLQVYEYCLAHNLKWQPQKYYITYDFETMEQTVNESTGKPTVINNRLIQLSVSSCIKSSKGLLTRHFDARSKDLFPEWLTFLFEIQCMFEIDHIEAIKKLDKGLLDVPVLNFNSAKFNNNLFNEHFNFEYHGMLWKVDNYSLIVTT